MIRTRTSRTRRKVATWDVARTSVTSVQPTQHHFSEQDSSTLQFRLNQLELQLKRLENMVVSQQLLPAVHDATQPLHRILLTDTASSRMALPALHHFVVANLNGVRGAYRNAPRPPHGVGDDKVVECR